MNRTRRSAAAERLEDFARSSVQHGAISQAQEQESSSPALQPAPVLSEPELELTLKQLSDQLLAAIQLSTTSLTDKIDEARIDVGLLRHDLQNLRDRVKETEAIISQLEDDTAPIPGGLASF